MREAEGVRTTLGPQPDSVTSETLSKSHTFGGDASNAV
jgi:hypothetical protein